MSEFVSSTVKHSFIVLIKTSVNLIYTVAILVPITLFLARCLEGKITSSRICF